jgi:hypothetical protein
MVRLILPSCGAKSQIPGDACPGLEKLEEALDEALEGLKKETAKKRLVGALLSERMMRAKRMKKMRSSSSSDGCRCGQGKYSAMRMEQTPRLSCSAAQVSLALCRRVVGVEPPDGSSSRSFRSSSSRLRRQRQKATTLVTRQMMQFQRQYSESLEMSEHLTGARWPSTLAQKAAH